MKIDGIRLRPVGVSRRTGYRNQHVMVQIASDDMTGIGEMSDMSHLPRFMPDVGDLERVLNHVLRGRDVRDIEAINAAMLESFPAGHDYYDKTNFIRCGVDVAVHDLLAKALGEPVSTLLGGRTRDRFKVCYPIFRHRKLEDVAPNLDTVEERLAAGFDVIRLYVGSNLDADVAFLRALRDRFGGAVHVKSLDFSHVLDWKEARTALKRFEEFAYDIVESPARRNDVEGLARFRASVDVPVSEHVWSMHGLHQMIRHDAVDVLNIAPIFIGGLWAARSAFAVAHAAGKRCLLGTTQELSVGTAAQAQLGAAMAGLTDVSDPTGPVLYSQDVVKTPVRYEDGYLLVPSASAPGLGVTLDEARMKELASPLAWEGISAASVLDRTVPS